MPSGYGAMSRRTAHPTLRWWRQQFEEGRWCRVAGFPGDAGSFLQVVLSVRPRCQNWYDRISGSCRLGHDSACLEEAAKTPGCLWGCDW